MSDLLDHIDHFQRRVLQDALADATARYWHRRADAFEWARPRSGDYIPPGRQDYVDQLDRRLAATAEACRARAALAHVHEWPEMDARAVA